jgi:hypothetical protein
MTHDTVTARTPSPGACLDDLLASRFLPKQWTARIWTESALPGRLQHCARNLPPDSEWRAYGDEDRIFFAVARAHARERPLGAAPAVDVYFLDANAAVYSAAVWQYDSRHGWWLDALLDLSYDCEHGWALGVLFESCADAADRVARPQAMELRQLTPLLTQLGTIPALSGRVVRPRPRRRNNP